MAWDTLDGGGAIVLNSTSEDVVEDGTLETIMTMLNTGKGAVVPRQMTCTNLKVVSIFYQYIYKALHACDDLTL